MSSSIENIDPALRDVPEQEPEPRAAESSSAPEKPKKVRGVVPGSSADFRRREANRLAAVRSRYRAHEKRSSVQKAVADLLMENTKLKSDISKLEREGFTLDSSSTALSDPIQRENDSKDGLQVEKVESSTLGVGQRGNDDRTSGDAAQDSHSRTILAALMSNEFDASGTGEVDDAEWMQGVEDMFRDVDAAGRLGELAAVATGRDDENNSGQDRIGDGQAPVEGSSKQNQREGQQIESMENAVAEKAVIREVPPLKYSAAVASSATTSAMAVAINVEMERVLREDLVATKLAIGEIEKQLTKIQSGESKGDSASISSAARLPQELISVDVNAMNRYSDERKRRMEEIRDGMPEKRQEVMEVKDVKMQEEEVLASRVTELQKVMAESVGYDKKRVTDALLVISGYIGSLLSEPDPTLPNLPHSGSFSSPAIALRTRGRPPKSIIGLPTPTRGGNGNKSTTKTGARQAKTPGSSRKSKLRKSTTSNQVAEGSAEGSTTADQNEQPEDGDVITHEEGKTDDQDAQDAEMILSHLQNTNAFADLLPHSDLADPIDPSLTNEGQDVSQQVHNGQGQNLLDGGKDIDASVLSRLGKGPAGSCDICSRTETTVWRKLTLGGTDLKVCNACGLYHIKFGVLRPPSLWGDGKALKKRRTIPRGSAASAEDGSAPTPKKAKTGKGKQAQEQQDGNMTSDAADQNAAQDTSQEVAAELQNFQSLDEVASGQVEDDVVKLLNVGD